VSNGPYSDYVIFVDESGDHGLVSIDPEYPVFVLAFVVVRKEVYLNKIVPAFQALKYKYWGHDQIIFHENEIRKEKGPFSLLRTNRALRESFHEELASIIADCDVELIASVIHKEALRKKYANPYNPYEITLLFCMEEVANLLSKAGQSGKLAHLIVEGRGHKENNELELEFRRICDNQKSWGYKNTDFSKTSFEMICADKKSNSTGLQLADLIARPIGLKWLRPKQGNRAFDIIHPKLKYIKYFP
jgi:hypothetical protein